MREVYTPELLAERWKCSAKHVRNLVNAGKLRGFRLGTKLIRIKRTDVEKYECQHLLINGVSPDYVEN